MVSSTITLVVTCFNAKNYLDTFQKFLKRNHDLFNEIVVVDDCSEDGTFAMLQLLQNHYDFVLTQTNTNSGRPSKPRNIGLDIAKSEYTMFLDIDDFIPRQYIEEVKINIEDKAIFSGTKFPININDYSDDRLFDTTKKISLNYKELKTKNYICMSGSCANTKLLKKYKFENRPLEDFIFWNKILQENKELRVIKYIDVAIGYNSEITLSPNKFKQVLRISKEISFFNVPKYLYHTLRLRFIEFKLKKRHQKKGS